MEGVVQGVGMIVYARQEWYACLASLKLEFAPAMSESERLLSESRVEHQQRKLR
jgi:hypothetical protein